MARAANGAVGRPGPGGRVPGPTQSPKGAGVVTDHAATERFQALYAEHHARVYAYAVSRVGRQLVDEVVSEVFLVAWRRRAASPRARGPAKLPAGRIWTYAGGTASRPSP